MSHNRREFIERLTAGTAGAMLSTLPLPFMPDAVRAFEPHTAAATAAEEWDTSWAKRLHGKYRAVFDVPAIDSGLGVWRASLWTQEYADVLKATPADLSSVVVMRHDGIALAMTQRFWDTYGVSKAKPVMHPITEQPTDRNPVLLASSRGEIPAQLDAVQLDKYIARGGIALACNIALGDMIALVTKRDGGSAESARTTALAGLVPGVILQPSGVFGAIYAQDNGCTYLRAS